MYNRYIPNGAGYTRLSVEDGPTAAPVSAESGAEPEARSGGLVSLLKTLKLERLDTGDVLLLLIILFLFLEGDDMELIITLGLMLLLGLD